MFLPLCFFFQLVMRMLPSALQQITSSQNRLLRACHLDADWRTRRRGFTQGIDTKRKELRKWIAIPLVFSFSWTRLHMELNRSIFYPTSQGAVRYSSLVEKKVRRVYGHTTVKTPVLVRSPKSSAYGITLGGLAPGEEAKMLIGNIHTGETFEKIRQDCKGQSRQGVHNKLPVGAFLNLFYL